MKLIPLTQGQFAMVDDEDYEYLNQWKWSLNLNKSRRTMYASRNSWVKEMKNTINFKMHRVIMNVTDFKLVCDHIDHNGLNNQKYNLRICTRI